METVINFWERPDSKLVGQPSKTKKNAVTSEHRR